MKKILLIEDNHKHSAALRHILEETNGGGIDVLEAVDGEEGVAVALREKPDLIVLDLLLPKKSGLEVLQDLCHHDSLHTTPVVILSNLEDPEIVERARGLGVIDYLVKVEHPIDDVAAKVRSLLP